MFFDNGTNLLYQVMLIPVVYGIILLILEYIYNDDTNNADVALCITCVLNAISHTIKYIQDYCNENQTE